MEEGPTIGGMICFWLLAGGPLLIAVWVIFTAFLVGLWDAMFFTNIGKSIARAIIRVIDKI